MEPAKDGAAGVICRYPGDSSRGLARFRRSKLGDQRLRAPLLFARQEFFLPDIGLLENRKESSGRKLPVGWHRNEPPFLFVPEMDMADALLYRAVAEEDEGPDHVMR